MLLVTALCSAGVGAVCVALLDFPNCSQTASLARSGHYFLDFFCRICHPTRTTSASGRDGRSLGSEGGPAV